MVNQMINFLKSIKRQLKSHQTLLIANAMLERNKVANNIKIDGVELFDKAMDSNYNLTHIGGGNHRLFDGSHTIVGAWKSTQTLEIPLVERIEGTTKALVNDFVTDKGLPLITLDKQTYNDICDALPLPKQVIYDLFKVNIYDIVPMFKTFRYMSMFIKGEHGQDLNLKLVALTTSQIVGQTSAATIVTLTTTIIAVTKSILDNDYIGTAVTVGIGISLGTLTMFNPFIGIPLSLSLNWLYRLLRQKLC